MKLTLAFGMQYDQASAGSSPVAPLKANGRSEVVAAEAVIDVIAEPADTAEVEFNERLGIFFLTYNLHGVPHPFIRGAENIDLFV